MFTIDEVASICTASQRGVFLKRDQVRQFKRKVMTVLAMDIRSICWYKILAKN